MLASGPLPPTQWHLVIAVSPSLSMLPWITFLGSCQATQAERGLSSPADAQIQNPNKGGQKRSPKQNLNTLWIVSTSQSLYEGRGAVLGVLVRDPQSPHPVSLHCVP